MCVVGVKVMLAAATGERLSAIRTTLGCWAHIIVQSVDVGTQCEDLVDEAEMTLRRRHVECVHSQLRRRGRRWGSGVGDGWFSASNGFSEWQ